VIDRFSKTRNAEELRALWDGAAAWTNFDCMTHNAVAAFKHVAPWLGKPYLASRRFRPCVLRCRPGLDCRRSAAERCWPRNRASDVRPMTMLGR
jgi:hypothetical protein